MTSNVCKVLEELFIFYALGFIKLRKGKGWLIFTTITNSVIAVWSVEHQTRNEAKSRSVQAILVMHCCTS